MRQGPGRFAMTQIRAQWARSSAVGRTASGNDVAGRCWRTVLLLARGDGRLLAVAW